MPMAKQEEAEEEQEEYRCPSIHWPLRQGTIMGCILQLDLCAVPHT